MVTDPIADMLTRIRNACRARHARVDIPLSKMKVRLATIMKEEGYLADFRIISPAEGRKAMIELKISYDKEQRPVITDLQRVSKPGLRRYMQNTDIPQIRRGLGIMIMSTSRGLMTDRSARKAKIGGEALCAVW